MSRFSCSELMLLILKPAVATVTAAAIDTTRPLLLLLLVVVVVLPPLEIELELHLAELLLHELPLLLPPKYF